MLSKNGGGIFTIWKCDPDEQTGNTFLTYAGEAVNAHVYVCVQKKPTSCFVPWTPILLFLGGPLYLTVLAVIGLSV